MSQLTPDNFITKWVERFADNTTGEINEAALREFAQDIYDNALLGKVSNAGDVIGNMNSGLPGYIGPYYFHQTLFSCFVVSGNLVPNPDQPNTWLAQHDGANNAGRMLIFSVIGPSLLLVNLPSTGPAHTVYTDAQIASFARNLDGTVPEPPQPEGYAFTTAPGTPTITGANVTETAAVINGNINVPGATLAGAFSAAGKHRYDLIQANPTSTPAYVRKLGGEVLKTQSAPTPSLDAGHLFVRFVYVTDGQAAPIGSQSSRDFTVSFTSPNREFLDYFESATAIKAIKLRSGIDSFSYSIDGGATYITPVLPLTSVINIPAGTEIRYRITYTIGSTLGAVYFQLS